MENKINEIITFWFGELSGLEDFPKNKSSLWFKKDSDVDKTIKERFEGDLKKAAGGQYDSWLTDPMGMLAQILLLDQFSRNMYRSKPESFAYDNIANRICKAGLYQKYDLEMPFIFRTFFYLPLEHSEDLRDQRQSIECFTELKESVPEEQKKIYEDFLEFAKRHKRIIDRFGRFPHRNETLDRVSTAEEKAFLKEPNSSF